MTDLAEKTEAPRTGDDVHGIEAALDALLTAIIEHDVTRRREPDTLRPRADTWCDGSKIPTREDSEVSGLIKDPIGIEYRLGISTLGRRLYRLGGQNLMHKTFDKVATLQPAKEGRRASTMDSAWNGIGEGENRWWS